VRRVTALVVIFGVAAAAQPNLEPSAAVQEKLATLDERRDLVELDRRRAWWLGVTAGAGYGIAAVSVAWGVIELIATSAGKPHVPLSGNGYVAPVPPAVLWVTAAIAAGVGLALHVTSGVLKVRGNTEEQAIDDEERPLRKQLSQERDKDPP
jgi:hypothetical protein